jgi:chemotaxis protein CheZ
MPSQRSVFRIEELVHRRSHSPVSATGAEMALRHDEMMAELKVVRALLQARGAVNPVADLPAQMPTPMQDDAAALKKELNSIYRAIYQTKEEIALLHATGFCAPEIGRVTGELDAVVGGSEKATHRILAAGEEIEELATTLCAAIKNIQDQNLARDILDQVTGIFEACNFQDIAGQRVTKVIATLKFIEERILRMMDIWGGLEQFQNIMPRAQAERDSHPRLVNGPKLDGESGYVSQKEIDAMFARRG